MGVIENRSGVIDRESEIGSHRSGLIDRRLMIGNHRSGVVDWESYFGSLNAMPHYSGKHKIWRSPLLGNIQKWKENGYPQGLTGKTTVPI